jgi:hypothetical protein
MTNEDINYISNASYLIGYYEGRLKTVAYDIENNNLNNTLKDIRETLEMGKKIWDNKYEKHYTQIK